MESAIKQKERADRRREQGLCTRCGKPVVPGRTRCEKHTNSTNGNTPEKQRKRYVQQQKQGLCKCGKPTVANKTLCLACNEQQLAQCAKRYARRKEQDLCTKCGINPARKNTVYCDACRNIVYEQRDTSENYARANHYKLKHGCIDCGYNGHTIAIEFDHTDPSTKYKDVSILIGSRYSWEVVEAEIKKCVVRCRRCHFIRHWIEEHGYSFYSNHTVKTRKERCDFLVDFKLARGCEICGYKEHPAALELDHLPGVEKVCNPADLPNRSWEILYAELPKLRVLCGICHAVYSYEGDPI